MNRFLRQICLFVISMLISVLLLLSLGAGLVWLFLSHEKSCIPDKAVLQVTLEGKVIERATSKWTQDAIPVIDLCVLKEAIQCAQEDKNIRGIYLECHELDIGWACLEEIRSALLDFQQAGKFVVAYGAPYTQKTYYLAAMADEIVLHPESTFPLRGLSNTVFFYKDLFERLAITPRVFRAGQYKSAVEPFLRQDMSEESKAQTRQLLCAIQDVWLTHVACARGIKKSALQAHIGTLEIAMPSTALRASLVSKTGYACDAEAWMKDQLALPDEAPISYVPFAKYAAHHKKTNRPTGPHKIAVLVVEGTIIDGTGKPGMVGAQTLISSLREIRKDASVKAVVLRINSPGGSALASDTLWKELMLTKEKKPIVASLSDVAASGGYYLAVACDRIFAHPTTITGSIGVFALFFDIHTMLQQKAGITTDVVKTHESADLWTNLGRPLRDCESKMIQQLVDKSYHTFLTRVATGRNMEQQAVACLASGRVWTGQMAQEKGLVDALGDLASAIQEASKLAELSNYKVVYWSESPTLLRKFFDRLSLSDAIKMLRSDEAVRAMWPSDVLPIQTLQELRYMQGMQTRLPYHVHVE